MARISFVPCAGFAPRDCRESEESGREVKSNTVTTRANGSGAFARALPRATCQRARFVVYLRRYNAREDDGNVCSFRRTRACRARNSSFVRKKKKKNRGEEEKTIISDTRRGRKERRTWNCQHTRECRNVRDNRRTRCDSRRDCLTGADACAVASCASHTYIVHIYIVHSCAAVSLHSGIRKPSVCRFRGLSDVPRNARDGAARSREMILVNSHVTPAKKDLLERGTSLRL